MVLRNYRSIVLGWLAVAAGVLLTSCFVTPGTFDATLDVHKDGHFRFAYNGEIFIAALSDLDKMASDAKAKDASGASCTDEQTGKEQPCRPQEQADKDKDQQADAERQQKQAMMRAMLGGADLSDPQAGQKLAARMQRQAGWKQVTYKGNGLFDVQFAVTGMLDHDFTFPLIEDMALSNGFVTIYRQDGGKLRIDAPGFAPASANPMLAMMGAMGGSMGKGAAGSEGDSGPGEMPKFPVTKGTFRIVTDAGILANNTEEGPQAAQGGKQLTWQVSPTLKAAPTALLQLDR